MSTEPSCICDVIVFPAPVDIEPGLAELPARQTITFPVLRRALLAGVPHQAALASFRGRSEDDFGVMLLELWAYTGEALSLYDRLIAEESYLRTARRRPSIRRLVDLLGYRPRPAVGASVFLGLLAEGKTAVSVPAGTGFRSDGSGGAPQVFETSDDAVAHPALNALALKRPRASTLSGTLSSLALAPQASVVSGDLVVVDLGTGGQHVRRVTAVGRSLDAAGARFLRADLDAPITLGAPVALAAARVLRPRQTAHLRVAVDAAELAPVTPGPPGKLTLDAQYAVIAAGSLAVVALASDRRRFAVTKREDLDFTVTPSMKLTVDGKEVITPPIKARMSVLTLDAGLNDTTRKAAGASDWSASDTADLAVSFDFVEVARFAVTPATTLSPGDPLVADGFTSPALPPPAPRSFLLVDVEERGAAFGGAMSLATGEITADPSASWAPPLVLPVTAHANVVVATRGETVPFEVLGSGDGAQANQRFKLKKAPLTYLPAPRAPDGSGVASTLTVWVDGVAWREVPSFFGQAPDAQVYVVRQDDAGDSHVVFGDGVLASRLPSGVDNVVARYRFGAGAAAPLAGGITQPAKPVRGLRGAVNPVAAGGGADAEPASRIRTLAPRSALLLGRAVSLDDLGAAAASTPGVVAATAGWAWDGTRQRPVAKVWVVGDAAALAAGVMARLRGMMDPATPIAVADALRVRASLSLDLRVDPRYVAADVAKAVSSALLDDEHGFLSLSQIGIGSPIFRSELFAEVLAIPGVLGVRAALWDGAPFTDYGKTPGPGAIFDLAAGLEVTGSSDG
jgi:hypothetical protein